MTVRKIIKINEDACTGCGDCIPNCPEGALRVIDGKARLISDLFCDGLGACVGNCPTGAMTVEEREAEPYDERKVMANIVKAGPNTTKAHLAHLKDHGETDLFDQAIAYLKEQGVEVPTLGEEECTEDAANGDPHATGDTHAGGGHGHHGFHGGCPGSKVIDMTPSAPQSAGPPAGVSVPAGPSPSHLRTWPVQIMLVPPSAPYLNGADIVLAADCVPFAFPDFHEKLLKGKIPLIGCPKLDDAQFYIEKLTTMFQQNDIRSVTCVHMEVPCCSGLVHIAQKAIAGSGKVIPFADVTIGIKGEILKTG